MNFLNFFLPKTSLSGPEIPKMFAKILILHIYGICLSNKLKICSLTVYNMTRCGKNVIFDNF